MLSTGERIANIRRKLKLTQDGFAKKIGISRAALSHYEKDRREPDYETLNKIADYCEVTIDYLLGRSDDPILNKEQQEEYNELERIIESLPEDEKKKVINMIRAYADWTHASNED